MRVPSVCDRHAHGRPKGFGRRLQIIGVQSKPMRRFETRILLGWALPLLAALAPRVAMQAQSSATAAVVQGARLIDGSGRPPIDDSVLVIEGGVIRAVGRK